MARRRRRKPKARPKSRAERLAEQHRWKLSLLREFIAEHGWRELRDKTIVPPGVDLFSYVRNRRSEYNRDEIESWLVAECEAIPGWSWDPVRDQHRHSIDVLRRFVKRRGWESVVDGTIVDGVDLTQWVRNRRVERNRGRLDRWIADALEAIPGWSWDPRSDGHRRNLLELRGHVVRYGWNDFRQHTMSDRGIAIGKWATNARILRKQGKLPRWLEAGLEAIGGWTWAPTRGRQDARIAMVRRFVEASGIAALTTGVVVRGVKLGVWVHNCRCRYADGTLSRETKAQLESIHGWRW